MSYRCPWFSCFMGEYSCFNAETLKFQGPIQKNIVVVIFKIIADN